MLIGAVGHDDASRGIIVSGIPFAESPAVLVSEINTGRTKTRTGLQWSEVELILLSRMGS